MKQGCHQVPVETISKNLCETCKKAHLMLGCHLQFICQLSMWYLHNLFGSFNFHNIHNKIIRKLNSSNKMAGLPTWASEGHCLKMTCVQCVPPLRSLQRGTALRRPRGSTASIGSSHKCPEGEIGGIDIPAQNVRNKPE